MDIGLFMVTRRRKGNKKSAATKRYATRNTHHTGLVFTLRFRDPHDFRLKLGMPVHEQWKYDGTRRHRRIVVISVDSMIPDLVGTIMMANEFQEVSTHYEYEAVVRNGVMTINGSLVSFLRDREKDISKNDLHKIIVEAYRSGFMSNDEMTFEKMKV